MVRAADPSAVDQVLAEHWPDARCELPVTDPWRLLVAVILSARTTDTQVLKALAVLDEHLLGIHAYAELDHRDLELLLRHLPLFRDRKSVV